MAAKINFNQVRNEVASSYEETLKKEGIIFAQEILKENLDKYINEIENHPVSKELDGGPDAENISDTLNGKENLFASGLPGMAIWREKLFAFQSANSQDATTYFKRPKNRVMEIGIQIEL